MNNPVVIAAAAALLLGCTGAFLWLRGRDRTLRERLQWVGAPLTGYGASAEQIALEESIFRPSRPQSRLAWLWTLIESRYPLVDARRALPRLLVIGVLAAAGAWAAMWIMGMSGWWTTPAAALAGPAGAWYALARMQARTEGLFIQQFPEVVDQIVRLAGAGLPPLEALATVAKDARPPVQPVLQEVTDGLLAGLDADTALGVVAQRVRLAEFTLFAAVIRLQRRAGGSISAAFSNLAETLRERRASGLKAHAATAQTRLTLMVLMLMPPLVLGVQSTTSPESVDILFSTEDGQDLLQLGVGLIAAGLIAARQMAARGPK